jgi:hypothetical protein
MKEVIASVSRSQYTQVYAFHVLAGQSMKCAVECDLQAPRTNFLKAIPLHDSALSLSSNYCNVEDL